MTRLLLAACAVALMAGGCSGGNGGGNEPPSSSSSTTAPAADSTTPTTTAAQPRLDLRGLGAVRVGMTLPDASKALGLPLEPVTPGTDECTVYAPRSGLDGVSFLVAGGTVARVDITAGATSTTEGLALGQSEAEAQGRYQNRLVVSDHDFLLGGHYLTLVPTERADAGFRLVAETDGRRVTALRAGRLPEVERTEGCA